MFFLLKRKIIYFLIKKSIYDKSLLFKSLFHTTFHNTNHYTQLFKLPIISYH
jgi:hypothetical protein